MHDKCSSTVCWFLGPKTVNTGGNYFPLTNDPNLAVTDVFKNVYLSLWIYFKQKGKVFPVCSQRKSY